jgi:hypothetical protein
LLGMKLHSPRLKIGDQRRNSIERLLVQAIRQPSELFDPSINGNAFRAHAD